MTIEERLENMEREVGCQKRRNRWLLGAILLLAGGLIVPLVFETTAFRAQAQVAKTAKEIRANNFVLEDENGEVRAVLGADKDSSILALSNENGKLCVTLGVIKDAPALILLDEKGAKRAALSMRKDGPTLILYDENGKPRAGLGVGKDGPGLTLLDENGKVIWSAIK